MNIIIKTIEYLNSGQIAVDVCDLPVYVLTKDIQYRNPEKFGPGKYFCWMGGLHIEMCIPAIHDELIDGSGLHEILSKGNMSIIKLKIFWMVLMLKQLGIVSKWHHQQSTWNWWRLIEDRH